MNHDASRLPYCGEGKRLDGFSLTELLVTIAILAVLTGIAIVCFSNLLPSARQRAAEDSAALLNRGVAHYDQVNSEITIQAAAGTDDEMAVVDLLKTRSVSAPGSPYIEANFTAVPSNSTDTVRLYWTGKFFKVIPEGADGAGITVNQ